MTIDDILSVEEGKKGKILVTEAVQEISEEEFKRMSSRCTDSKKSSRQQMQPGLVNIGGVQEISEEEFKRMSSRCTDSKKSSRQQMQPGLVNIGGVYAYEISSKYASSLYSLAWAQAVQSKTNYAFPESKSDSDSKESSSSFISSGEDDDENDETTCLEGRERIVNDIDDDCYVGEGNDKVVIDLETEDVKMDDELMLDVDSLLDCDSIENDNSADSFKVNELDDTPMEDSALLTILIKLESVSIDKTMRSFDEVCTQLHDLLAQLKEVLSDCSESETGSWNHLSFTALETINSGFLYLSSVEKVQHKGIYQRLLSYVIRHNPANFLPTQISEIEIMLQNLDESPVSLSSMDNKKKDLTAVSLISSDKKLDSNPLLDLQRGNYVVGLSVSEVENKTLHPHEVHVVKQSNEPSLFIIPERLPCHPTLLKGEVDEIKDVGGEVSKTSPACLPPAKLRDPRLGTISRKQKPVEDLVSSALIHIRQRNGLGNRQVNAGEYQQLHGSKQIASMEGDVKSTKNGSVQNPIITVQNSRGAQKNQSQRADETEISVERNELKSQCHKAKKRKGNSIEGSIFGQFTTNQKNNIGFIPQTSQSSSDAHFLEGFSEQQIATIQKERMRRIEEQKKLFSNRKLSLVLDLDHTVLNSARFAELDPALEEMLKKRLEQESKNPHRLLFRIPHMGLWTKFRPGIWKFLKKASKLYELHLYTMGNKMYAAEMAKLLDPKGVLFAGRVMSRGDDNDSVEAEERFFKVKDLDGVLGMESNVVIIDDSVRVWPLNKLNLIAVERYIYFPCSRRQFGLQGPSLLEIDHDERPENGTIASAFTVIERIHKEFFSQKCIDEADVRSILASQQRKILAGCRIVFSRVFPIGASNSHKHPLWQTAEQFGACCTSIVDDAVTHVVANARGTEKVNWALSNGRFVVCPGWIEASAFLYRRANEKDFAIKI